MVRLVGAVLHFCSLFMRPGAYAASPDASVLQASSPEALHDLAVLWWLANTP